MRVDSSGGSVTNIVIAGLGGQGVLKACEILAGVAFRAGLDVKKAEVHGMSRRGGSVACDVRFGDRVLSPMVPTGEADFLVSLSSEQAEANRWRARPGATLIEPRVIAAASLREKRSLNVALLGALSRHLPFPESVWLATIRDAFSEIGSESNCQAFEAGRRCVMECSH
jgi:indolepyruvate ferredoxin oxidoreductase beta subunit